MKMELQTAIEILEYHQQWRLGKREAMIHEPKKLTEAFDIVLSEVKKIRLDAVSGQSEQLICPDCKLPFTKEELQIKEHCFNCGWEFAN